MKGAIKAAVPKIKQRLKAFYWQHVSPKSTIRECHWGHVRERRNPRLCLFSTYDHQGKVDAYVKEYVRQLQGAGFDVVVVSTSPSLEAADLNDLLPLCRAVVLRKNVGIDFASWKAATQILPDWTTYEGVLLTNDSIYGPFSDLRPLLDTIDQSKAQMVGLTDSHEIDYHLQSYFLYIKQELLRSEPFQSFWKSIRIHLDKYRVIDLYEIGLSRFLRAAGAKIEALYPYQTVLERALAKPDYPYLQHIKDTSVNPTLFMWETLLEDFRFPFLKTEILKINRHGFVRAKNWGALIPANADKWRKLVFEHLTRAFPDAAGLSR